MASGPSCHADTSLWLHNKLGTSNDSWTGGSIVSQLSPEILERIQDCFQGLQPQVKLKLLLSLFHIPRRNLEQWRQHLENILVVAQLDSEPWVCMLSELMKTYPKTGQLNSKIEAPDSNRKIFNDLLLDLKKSLKHCSNLHDVALPMECHYLNKNAFISTIGHQPQLTNHFGLRKKPKAVTLRADLLVKAQDTVHKLRNSGSSGGFPMRKSTMPRKMSDSGLLKGQRMGSSTDGFRNSRISRNVCKKEGGVKLLDITEQPMGFAASRKRKRQQELEEAKKIAEESQLQQLMQQQQQQASPPPPETPTNNMTAALVKVKVENLSKPEIEEEVEANSGFDVKDRIASVGINNYATSELLKVVKCDSEDSATAAASVMPIYAPQVPPPVYAPTPAAAPLPQTPLVFVTSNTSGVSGQRFQPASFNSTRNENLASRIQALQPIPPASSSIIGGNTTSLLQSVPVISSTNSVRPVRWTTTGLPATTLSNTRVVQLPTQPIPQSRVTLPSQIQQLRQPIQLPQLQQQLLLSNTSVTSQQTQLKLTQQRTIDQQNIAAGSHNPSSNLDMQINLANHSRSSVSLPGVPKLSLTREQMLEAETMFGEANIVTRPEKALILGFMAGSRDNPFPQLGNIITIKLSEDRQYIFQNDGTYIPVIVEAHFQMNYDTGEWKRAKTCRQVKDYAK